MKTRKHITGIILAGGKSSRMGVDKGLMTWEGVPFIKRIITTLIPLVKDLIIVSNNPEHGNFGQRRVEDLIEASGPLAGLYTGLFHSGTEYNLVLSCDVPLIDQKILHILLEAIDENSDVIQLKSNGHTLPLIAIYKKQCLHHCFELLRKGERRLQVAVEQLNTKTITLHPKWDLYVKNINTLEQFKALEHEIER